MADTSFVCSGGKSSTHVLVCTRNDEGISVQAMRRSVDMGSLAHNANMRHGANTASMQGAPQAGMPQQVAPNQKVGRTLSRI